MNKLIAVVVLGACGGGGSSPPDAARFFLDAKPADAAPPDAPADAPPDAAQLCSVFASLGGLTLGTPSNPPASDWFRTPTTGPNTGKKTLSVGGRLPSSTAALVDVLMVELVSENGVFPLNTAIAFDGSAGAANGTAPYAAAGYVFGDFDTSTMSIANVYWAASGSITLTQIGETNGSFIQGSVTATTFREIDTATGIALPGGCTTELTALNFNVTQAAAFQHAPLTFAHAD